MFRIRQEQMDRFSAERTRDFENRVMAHLLRTCPEQIALMPEEEVRGAIRQGIHKAATYHVFRACNVASFIQIQFEEGHDLDADPERPWARAILADQKLDESAKIDYLWARIDGYEEENEEEDEEEAEEPEEEEDLGEQPSEEDEPDDEEVGDEDLIEDEDGV